MGSAGSQSWGYTCIHQQIATPDRCHPLQFGFTSGKSGQHAAFLLTECIADSRDKRKPVFIASLDVQKAFDTVQHASLLDKLHALGINGIWWRLKKNSQEGQTTRIVWEGAQAKTTFPNYQGNGQGKLTSPDDYLSYLYQLMENLSSTGLGYYIGGFCVSSPTCADDMAVLAEDPYELQLLISIIEEYANAEHYTIHPVKSEILPFNVRSEGERAHLTENTSITINGRQIPIKEEMVHLGVKRNLKSAHPTIDDRLSTGNRTLYALMGSGLHGTNGLPVKVSLHLYNIYVIPRLLYGIESITLTEKAIRDLEIFQRRALQSILGLPERTACAGLYTLSGAIPIRYQIHIRMLTFLLALLKDGITRSVILRQYTMKHDTSASWVIQAKKILREYKLPTIADLYTNTPAKLPWKKTVKQAIYKQATEEINKEAQERSTLKFLNPSMSTNALHDCVDHVENPRQVTRANIKSRLLVGVYPLATTRLRIKQTTDTTCELCDTMDEEDETHFLTSCERMADIRNRHMPQILQLIPDDGRTEIADSKILLTQLILDAGRPEVTSILHIEPHSRPELESATRDYIYALHVRRAAILRQLNDRTAKSSDKRTES